MRFVAVFIVLILIPFVSFTQSQIPRRAILFSAGIVSYYFWEENEKGEIIGEVQKPYFQNYLLSLEKLKLNQNFDFSLFSKNIQPFFHSFRKKDKRYRLNNESTVCLLKDSLSQNATQALIKRKGDINKSIEKCVMYFDLMENGKTRFAFSSDSVKFQTLNKKEKLIGHYQVIRVWKEGKIVQEKLLAYSGDDLSESFSRSFSTYSQRMLVFANGYRGPNKEFDESDNLITQNDRYNYWFKLDSLYAARLKSNFVFYIDGSFSVTTSVHRNQLNFGISMARTKIFRGAKKLKRKQRMLNMRPNEEGFIRRMEEGKIAGLAYLNATYATPEANKTRDTLDLVCHSMGYAYSLGFLEIVEKYIVLGRCYILAPENASQKGYEWSKFEEVWQYGTNLSEEDNAEPIYKQDGVAPQVPVKDLLELASEKYGRVYFPKNYPVKMNFIDSHMIYSYYWIFEVLSKGMPGSVYR